MHAHRRTAVLVLLLVLTGLCTLYRWLYDAVWWTEEKYISPAPLGTALPIRNDPLGEGVFGAKRRERTHKGLDIVLAEGTPVRVSRPGSATTGFDKNGYGHYVKIVHDDGSLTLYAHMERPRVLDAERVRQGEVIGAAGRSGNADYEGMTTHLHFEIRIDGEAVDPLPLLYPFSPYDSPWASTLAGRFGRKMP